ncbi:MAG: SGNH/GDSL hydrolase family protein [Vicinamibacteria bacterium]|jgi:lysophospholipase L1-like esterase|nr:SGNH/GDSL hydrolase family protein [Vicinamibacteria bacterium]
MTQTPAARAPKRLKRGLLLLAPGLTALLLLGAIEGILRVTTPPLTTLSAFVRAPEQQANFFDRRQVSIFEGDPLLFWRLRPGLPPTLWDFTVLSTNTQHLRYPRPIGRKPPCALRIACFGDSVTFGYRVPVAFPERPQDFDREAWPYPALMEKILARANPAQTIEVIPFAVPGYTSHQGLAWLRRDIAWIQPDIVTLCFGWNDTNLRSAADRATMPVDAWHVWARTITSHSQALLKLSRGLGGFHRARGGVATPVARVSQEDFVTNLMTAADLAELSGARAILIGVPYRDADKNPGEAQRIARYRAALRESALARGRAYLEIPELTEAGAPSNERLFGELIHPNHLGHRLMAARLLRYMLAQGFLGTLRVPELPEVS